MSAQVPLFENADSKRTKTASRVAEIAGETFDLKQFVEQFEVIATASGGLVSLRKLILELAIRGHLSIGAPTDDSAHELRDAAEADRVARQHRGDARQMEELAEVSTREAPFELPRPWVWTRIGLAMNLVNGRAFKPKDWSTSGLPIVRIQNLNNASAPFNYCNFNIEPKHHLRRGDFLISWSGTPGTSFGAFIWNGPDGVLNQHIFRAEIYGDSYELGFLRIAINARLDEMIAQAHGGVGLQHITKGKLEALVIPLPPLAEQKRIVAKVDQLMALCNELEVRQTKERETAIWLNRAALDALTTAEGPEEAAASFRRVAENFETLFSTSGSVSDLRRTILSLALCGKLVPQHDSDWIDGSLSLKLMETAAEQVRSSDSRRKVEPLEASDIPFEVPNGWTWARLGSLGITQTGTTPSTQNRAFYGDHIPFVAPGDISDAAIRFDNKGLSRSGLEQGRRVLAGSILMVCIGGSIGKVNKTDRDVSFNQQLNAITPFDSVDLEFLLGALRSSYFQNEVARRAAQGTLPIISKSKWESIPVPVPPIAEQRRIAKRMKQLMALCDTLEAALRRAESTAQKLAEAVVAELVA